MIIQPRFILAAMLLVSPLLRAQQSPLPPANEASTQESFLVTLTLKTTDHEKKTIDQSYTMAVMTHAGPSNVRAGDRIPLVVGMDGTKNSMQYIDVGTNIDLVNAKTIGSLFAVDIKVEISAAVPETLSKLDPTIRQAAYSVYPVVPIGKAVTVYSSTDSVTWHKVEIQIQVEPIPAA